MSRRISWRAASGANGSPLGLLSIEGITQRYLWVQIVFCWVFDGIVVFWLYRGYIGMIALRRRHFNSVEYQGSLHSRTLLVIDVPKQSRSDDGLAQLASQFKPDGIHPAQAHIARAVGGLPELLEQHENAVKRLEKYLAVYLKNPDKLPEKRPTCKPKGMKQKIDAIDYYTVSSLCSTLTAGTHSIPGGTN
jgi:calcium permeable stress-gated cation channel